MEAPTSLQRRLEALRRFRFLRDCISRALLTLPYATITARDLAEPRAALDRIGTSGDPPETDRQTVARIVDLLRREAALHEAAGEAGKAALVIGFAEGLADFWAQVPRRG